MAASKFKARVRVVPSSGNVFADLGFADAQERQTKVRLAAAINRLVERSKLTQADAGVRLGINQPKVSALRNYKLDGFSIERLMHFLTALDQDIEIVIRNKRGRREGRIVVRGAAKRNPQSIGAA